MLLSFAWFEELDAGGLSLFVSCDASRVWRGIEFGFELLKEGIIWQVGNSRSIRIQRDNWIPRQQGLLVAKRSYGRVDPLKTRLIDPCHDGEQWLNPCMNLIMTVNFNLLGDHNHDVLKLHTLWFTLALLGRSTWAMTIEYTEQLWNFVSSFSTPTSTF